MVTSLLLSIATPILPLGGRRSLLEVGVCVGKVAVVLAGSASIRQHRYNALWCYGYGRKKLGILITKSFNTVVL